MTIRLRYGDTWLETPSPSGLEWIDAIPAARPLDPDIAIASDADATVIADRVDRVSVTLRDTVKAARRVLIAVPDRTRPAALPRVLPALFAWLDRTCSARPAVTVVIAGGTHTPDDRERVAANVPATWGSAVSVVAHDSRDESTHRHLGDTPAGTPIRLSRHLFEHDVVIAVGGIGYHYFAGFSGGRKTIFPGLGAYESIRQNHRLILDPDPGQGLHPGCRPGNLDGNPIHADLLDVLAAVDTPVLGVNALIDEAGELEGMVVGDAARAHTDACAAYAGVHRLSIPAPADLLIADAGGHPRDIDLVQTHKALVHLRPAVREGGALVIAARCGEGLGSTTFARWFRHPDSASMEAALRADYTLNSHTALSLRRITERTQVFMITELPDELLAGTGIQKSPRLEDALAVARDAVAIGGDPPRAAVIHAPQTVLISIA